MRRLLLILPLLAVAACSSDDDFTPPGTPPTTIPTIGGTYSSPTMWTFDLTSASGQNAFTCSGGVTIANQVGTMFSGSFFIADPACGSISGSVASGSFAADGSISFELTVPGSNPNFLTAAFACTYVSGDRIVTGTLVDRQLDVQARTVMNCGQEGEVTLNLRLSGSR